MKKTFQFLLPVFIAVSLPAFAQNAAVVNGKPIPAARVEAIVNEAIQQGQEDSKELRETIQENLILREVLVQEADRKKLGNRPDVKNQTELMRRNILIRALMDDFFKQHPVTDTDINNEYGRLKALAGDTEYDAQHILVATEEEAKAIIELLNKGRKFDALAKDKSTDSTTAAAGGDLGWSVPAVYVHSFAEALTGLKKGQFTPEPVQTSFGFHIIRVKDTRPLVFPPIDELKVGLEQELQEAKWNQYISELRSKAKIR